VPPRVQGRAFAKTRAYVASLPETEREPPSAEALEAESLGLTVPQMRSYRERSANEARRVVEHQARAALGVREKELRKQQSALFKLQEREQREADKMRRMTEDRQRWLDSQSVMQGTDPQLLQLSTADGAAAGGGASLVHQRTLSAAAAAKFVVAAAQASAPYAAQMRIPLAAEDVGAMKKQRGQPPSAAPYHITGAAVPPHALRAEAGEARRRLGLILAQDDLANGTRRIFVSGGGTHGALARDAAPPPVRACPLLAARRSLPLPFPRSHDTHPPLPGVRHYAQSFSAAVLHRSRRSRRSRPAPTRASGSATRSWPSAARTCGARRSRS